MTVMVNSDMGESYGIHSFGNDAALMPLIDSANVACGFHAGDPVGIHETVVGAAPPASPSARIPACPTRWVRTPGDGADAGRGARRCAVPGGSARGFLDAEGVALSHIKPHGSLYGMVARDEALMNAVCDVAVQYGVAVYGMAGTAHERVAERRGVPFVAEFYVDLGYRDDGSLIIARRPHATPPDLAARRARLALTEGAAETDSGARIPVRFDSICVHSDTPNAVEVATAVRAALSTAVPT